MNPSEDAVIRLPGLTVHVDARNARVTLTPRHGPTPAAAVVLSYAGLEALLLEATTRKEDRPPCPPSD